MVKHPVWIEMPAAGTGAAKDPVRSKYPIEGNAFIVHYGGKVYAMLGDELAREQLTVHVDCRRLTRSEAREFEQGLPFPVPQRLDWLAHQDGVGGAWGFHRLGDAKARDSSMLRMSTPEEMAQSDRRLGMGE